MPLRREPSSERRISQHMISKRKTETSTLDSLACITQYLRVVKSLESRFSTKLPKRPRFMSGQEETQLLKVKILRNWIKFLNSNKE